MENEIRAASKLVPVDCSKDGHSAIYQGPVVQTLDTAIHRISYYPADKKQENQLRYPLDRDLPSGYRHPYLLGVR